MTNGDLERFLDSLAESLERATFVKATVGNYKGRQEQLQKVLLRPVTTKKGDIVQFTYRYADRDEARNFTYAETPSAVADLVSSGFRSAVLFTTEKDLTLSHSRKGRPFISESAPSNSVPAERSHDRRKNLAVDPSEPFLRILGVTTHDGRVRDKQQAKFRQINRFVEIVGGLIEEAGIEGGRPVRVTDMGSGKGYLTFALYSHLANRSAEMPEVTGIEQRGSLVEACNAAAVECGFGGLRFVRGRIGEADSGRPDVLIALHACDTATDDAIFEGLNARARVIVTAPCCQKELRDQIRFPEQASRLNAFGLLLEQETESVTDGIRAVILEDSGYSVKMIDFVSPDHTPKNTLIAAVRKAGAPDRFPGSPDAERLMRHFGVSSQRLYTLLSGGPIA